MAGRAREREWERRDALAIGSATAGSVAGADAGDRDGDSRAGRGSRGGEGGSRVGEDSSDSGESMVLVADRCRYKVHKYQRWPRCGGAS